MRREWIRFVSTMLVSGLLVSASPAYIYASGADVSATEMKETESENGVPFAGVSLAFSVCAEEGNAKEVSMLAEALKRISEKVTPVVEEPKSEYADIAIAQVDNYVNVRAEANTESEVLGKLYNNSAATVLETTENGWYKITSGNVTGYVKCEYVVVGDEELARKASTRYATVTTQTLYVRMEPTTESKILTMLPEGDDFVVVDESMRENGWVKVTTVEGEGYVSTDYVELWTDFVTAESKEEEAARLKKEEEERKKAAAAAEAARKKKEQQAAAEAESASGSTSYVAPSSSNGQAVVDYAC